MSPHGMPGPTLLSSAVIQRYSISDAKSHGVCGECYNGERTEKPTLHGLPEESTRRDLGVGRETLTQIRIDTPAGNPRDRRYARTAARVAGPNTPSTPLVRKPR